MSEYSVELKGLNKIYSNLLKEDTVALKDIHLQIKPAGDCRRALQHACSGGGCDAPRRVGGDGRFCHYAS